MQQQQTKRPSTSKKSKAKSPWRKMKRVVGLYLYEPSGVYHGRVKLRGRVYRESLRTTDFAFAKRKLAEMRRRLDRTDPTYGKISFARWLEEIYFPTLRGAPGALKAKHRIIAKVKTNWTQARAQPMSDLRESQVAAFLAEHYGKWSASAFNAALWLLRDAFALAVRDHVILQNPCSGLKSRRRAKPIRLTPSFEQFQAIVADVRAQPFNADALDSADFLEAMGLLGLGQAELSGIRREHVDLPSGRIAVYRHKTSCAFTVPIFPQVRALIERLCENKKPSDRLFRLAQARKALTNSCRRLGFANYTQRSLRRMFITRCIEKGIDVKVIAGWQGHRDQGVLILQTYSHIRPEHEQWMAQLLTTELPENVISLDEADQD